MGVSTVRWWPVVVLVSLTLSNHLVEPENKKKYTYITYQTSVIIHCYEGRNGGCGHCLLRWPIF